MNQSYGDEFNKVCDGLCKIIDSGTFPFVFGALIASFVVGTLALHVGFDDGKSAGRQELLQEFNKAGWYYDERAKEFWRRGEK